MQRFVLLVTLLLWAVTPVASWFVGLGCYVLALCVVNAAVVFFPGWVPWSAETRGRRWALIGALLLLPMVTLFRMTADASLGEKWDTFLENLSDRRAAEQRPAVWPALLVTHEPQRLFLYAPGAQQVAVRWTPESPELSTVALGRGVFMLDFDPRTDSALQRASGGELSAAVIVDKKTSQRVMRLIRPQPHPRRMSSAPEAGLAAAVSEESDEIVLVHRDGEFQSISVGDGPTDSAFLDEGKRLLVTHRFTPEIQLIDTATNQIVKKIAAPAFQVAAAVSPDGKHAAVAIDAVPPGIMLLSAPDFDTPQFVELPFSPDRLEFGDDATLVVTDRREHAVHFLAIDSGWKLTATPLRFPRTITALGRAPDGKLALATTASQVGEGPVFANHFIENTVHLLDVQQRQIVATYITDRRGLQQDEPGSTEHGISPLALATVDGRLLAACAGSNEVAELGEPGAAPRYLSLDPSPLFAPQGLADLGDGVWCVASPVDGTLGVFERDGSLRRLIRLAADDETLAKIDTAALTRRRGERTFFEGTRAGIACQSCHLDAAADFSSHDIGQSGPVDTLSVRGLLGTSPYLRDASHWRLRDLHDVARVGYRNHPREVDWDRAGAIAHYLESLPPQPHARARESDSVQRMRAGVEAFFDADCAVCHTPPAFTNLGQHPAAGLFPDHYGSDGPAAGVDKVLDTPTLRGVSISPPFLHDGRAKTLRAVLTEWNRSGRHGNTVKLSAVELDDLLYFLERL